MPDKYDEAIEALQNKTTDDIHDIWGNAVGSDEPGSDLFKNIGPYPDSGENANGEYRCGCPTQVAFNEAETGDDDFTARVRQMGIDGKIPEPGDDHLRGIKHEHLLVFAELQREADEIFNR